jgi:competence protein ComGC
MKTRTHSHSGLSLIEILIVIATIALLVLFVVLWNGRSRSRGLSLARRITCVSNLKQVGMAFRIYAADHEDNFPLMVSTNFNPTNTSGSREFAGSSEVFRHFQAASNELVNPSLLRCPSDDARRNPRSFVSLSNTNLSYFVGLDAVPSDPQLILSGDRNITGGTVVNSNLLLVRPNNALSWTKAMHVLQGDVGLADGSVQQLTIPKLNHQIAAVTNAVVRLAIP